ncbi:hypothetical protein N7451_006064 [Penicillium sp. IBT 35674x]|nr:hypothetical protein N7451_006064 [Penicillium sp. IBT 35674x]
MVPLFSRIVLFLSAGYVNASALRSAVLFQNNGNWTEHAAMPSALIFYDAVPFAQAQSTCASENETLLAASDLSGFSQSLLYQLYLANISPDQTYWVAEDAGDRQLHEHRPFLCTNSAPLVDQVDPGYYRFPTLDVESTGITYTGVRDHMAFRFLGIPYAMPPVGDRRFVLPEPWHSNETRHINATIYGPTCPGTPNSVFYNDEDGLNPWGDSEDCLFLNIYTPYIPGEENAASETLKPVMFWLHGGGGTGSDSTFDGASLVSRSDVVLVTINWRQGNFGQLSLNDGFVMGNYGVADTIEALQWVHDHIASFGGDKNRVTVFGQSGGGQAVVTIAKSPKANGLLSGAIVQSGLVTGYVTQDQVANVTVPAVAAVCGDLIDGPRLACLRSLSVNEIQNNISYTVGNSWEQIFFSGDDEGAIIDGIYVTNNTIAALKAGQVNNIHFMSGSMPEEAQSLLGTAIAPNATNFTATLESLDGSDYPAWWPTDILESGLWNNGSDPINAYNETINAYTTFRLTCPGEQLIQTAYKENSFKSLYYYTNQRAYGLSFYETYDLCTFPIDEPETPYYRCHSGDLYETFGTYYLFDQPIRTPEDVGYTNLHQDMWGSFARTGNPNPAVEYLDARGYYGSREIFSRFTWPEFDGNTSMSIEYPMPWIDGLPWAEKCAFVEDVWQLP